MKQINTLRELTGHDDPLSQRALGLRSMTPDEQRTLVHDIEVQIKAMTSRPKSKCEFPKFSEYVLEHTAHLLELRCLALNEMALHASEVDIKLFERQNNKIARLTEVAKGRMRRVQQKIFGTSMIDEWVKEYITMEATLRFSYADTEQPAPPLASDDYYGSDFNYILSLLDVVADDWYKDADYTFTTDNPTADANPQPDDYLAADAYKHIRICPALRHICCRLPYSIPDVLHMTDFRKEGNAIYRHEYFDPNKDRKEYYDAKQSNDSSL